MNSIYGCNQTAATNSSSGQGAQNNSVANTSSYSSGDSEENVVTVYKDEDYKGASKGYAVGSYTTQQMMGNGIVSNSISSVKVSRGYRVTFYEDNNFGGFALVKTGNDPTLVDDKWDNRVSSIKVERQEDTQQIENQAGTLTVTRSKTQSWCHTFFKDLSPEDSGDREVEYLHMALEKEGYSYAGDIESCSSGFGADVNRPPVASCDNTNLETRYRSGTSDAVKQFQRKYKIDVDGNFGPSTRAKMNLLYGCNLSTPSLTPATGGEPVVTVYSEIDYQGTATSYPIGSYTLAQMQAKGTAKGSISSVEVAPGYRAIFYEKDNFKDYELLKTKNDPTLIDNELTPDSRFSWNDIVSSMKVAPPFMLTITSPPDGGETWKVGETHNITWTSQNITSEYNIGLLCGNVTYPISNVSNANRLYSWTIPNMTSLPPLAENCKIQIQAIDNVTGEDIVRQSNVFTIARDLSHKSISIISPTAGEKWTQGTNRILWSSSGVNNIKIQLISSGGTVFDVAESNGTLNQYIWRVGKNITPADNYRIKIIDQSDPYVSAISDNFSIISSSVCKPNWSCTDWSVCSGGIQTKTCTDLNNCEVNTDKPAESQFCTPTPTPTPTPTVDLRVNGTDGQVPVPKNEYFTLSWTVSNATSCTLYYSGVVSNGVPNKPVSISGGSFSAGFGTDSSKTYLLNCTNSLGQSASDKLTVIASSTEESSIFSVLSPGKDAVFYRGQTLNIVWDYDSATAGSTRRVDVYLLNLSLESTHQYYKHLLSTNYPAYKENFSWAVPNSGAAIYEYPDRNNYKICIYSISGETGVGFSGCSDNFTIKGEASSNLPKITIISPNGGETWKIGDANSITWSSENLPDETALTIYLRTPSRGDAYRIGSAINPSSGSFSWTIPSLYTIPIAADYKVRIYASTAGKTSTFDDSDDYFTITSSVAQQSILDSMVASLANIAEQIKSLLAR
jgi:hypothetical protein